MAEQIIEHRIGHYARCQNCRPGRYCFLQHKHVRKEDIALCSSFKTAEERKKFSLSIHPTALLKSQYDDVNLQEWMNYIERMTDTKYHICKDAIDSQKLTNHNVIHKLESIDVSNYSFDDIEIKCYGHRKSQFDSLEDRPYLTKINLNDLNTGEYSGNNWAEARVYADPSSFDTDKTFLGFTTASWNQKFIGEKLDDFENWAYSKYLMCSKPEDKIVLCANVECPCIWHGSFWWIYNKHSVLSKIMKEFSFVNMEHRKVAFCNQFIAHKSLFNEYREYLQNENIMARVKRFAEKHLRELFRKNRLDPMRAFDTVDRCEAWTMEAINTLWLSTKRDYTFIPSGIRNSVWYRKKSIEQREKEITDGPINIL